MKEDLVILFDDRQDEEIDQAIIQNMERAIGQVLLAEGLSLKKELSVSLVTDQEIQELNRDYRGKDSVTDVLSFPLEDDFDIEDREGLMLGDIIIATGRAKEQAQDYDHSFLREMVYLTVHSMLHLLGYDHMNEEDKLLMRSREKEIMKDLDILR